VGLWRRVESGPPQLIRLIGDANHAQFTKKGDALLAAQSSGTIQRLSLSGRSVAQTTLLRWHEAQVQTLAESADGAHLVSIDRDHAALWTFDGAGSLLSPAAPHVVSHHPDGSVTSAIVADDGRWVA